MSVLEAPLRIAEAGRLLERALARKTVRAVYQPIVELASGQVVAYEALARGPAGRLELPATLFAVAERTGLLPHLEWTCREVAIQGAIDAGLGSVTSLFVNVEPRVAGGELPRHLDALVRTARHKLRIVLELTERDLTRRPADLLRLVRWARENWWGVALDDVGAEPASLALLPFVRPDVIKLDLRLVQGPLAAADRATVAAVQEQARATGATILAEGIETEEHEAAALALGATLGQGWRYGRPGPLVPGPPPLAPVRFLPHEHRDAGETPFDLLAASAMSFACRQSQLDVLSRELEANAVRDGAPVVLSAFGQGLCTPAVADRYERLAADCLFCGVAGLGLPDRRRGAVRYSELDVHDPVSREWVVTAVGPRVARGLAARGISRVAADDPEVEVVVSDDRDAVVAAARLLMERAVPA